MTAPSGKYKPRGKSRSPRANQEPRGPETWNAKRNEPKRKRNPRNALFAKGICPKRKESDLELRLLGSKHADRHTRNATKNATASIQKRNRKETQSAEHIR